MNTEYASFSDTLGFIGSISSSL